MGVPFAEQFLRMTTRPSVARQEQVNKSIRVWLHERAERNRKTSCPTLDKLTDSRLARSLLRRRGPAPAIFLRAAHRQWAAYSADKFGTKKINPTCLMFCVNT